MTKDIINLMEVSKKTNISEKKENKLKPTTPKKTKKSLKNIQEIQFIKYNPPLIVSFD